MARKKPVGRGSRPPLPRRLLEGLDEAVDLMRRKRWDDACDALEELDERHPNQPEVLGRLVNVFSELKDHVGQLGACERLSQADPHDLEVRHALAGAYLMNEFPALALRAFRDVLRRAPDDSHAPEVQELVSALQRDMQEILTEMGVSEPDGAQLAEWHEEVQVHLSQGRYAQARRLAQQLLQRLPDFAPALNNITQAYWAEGDLAQAIATAERVLAFAPDNIHALSNAARCLCLSGRLEEARACAGRLLASQAPATSRWVKQAEPLAYLGDDARMLELFRQAEQAGEGDEPMLHHFAAVAALRLGRESEARQRWQAALKLQPGFSLARENLDDLRRPVGERNVPWPFTLGNWISRRMLNDLMRLVGGTTNRGAAALQQAAQRFLREHPEAAALVPLLLDRGDPQGRQFALMLAEIAETPEMNSALKDFALGPRGPDQARLKAGQAAAQAGALPSGAVRMWMSGEWRDLLLLGIEIHGEPVRGVEHKPQVERWLKQAIEAIHAGSEARAEGLLQQALAVEPDAPDLLHNLAAVYGATGREAEAETLTRQIFERHPDYLFARASLARMAALSGDAPRARELLTPLLSRRRMHFAEFAAFVSAQIDMHLAEKNKDAARSWVEMWEQVDAEHPALELYRRRVGKAPRVVGLDRLPGGRA